MAVAAAVGIAVAAALVAAALYLAGGHNAGQRPGPVQLSGSQALISGRIVDAGSKGPIGGVVIRVEGRGGTATGRTDQQGAYQLVVSVTGPVAVTVDAAGYMGQLVFGSICPGERVTFSPQLTRAAPGRPPPGPGVLPSRGSCG